MFVMVLYGQVKKSKGELVVEKGEVIKTQSRKTQKVCS